MAWSVLGRDDNATLDQLFEKQLDYYGRVSLQQSNSGYIQGRWDISCPENFTAFGGMLVIAHRRELIHTIMLFYGCFAFHRQLMFTLD